jgi:hypothetical protein
MGLGELEKPMSVKGLKYYIILNRAREEDQPWEGESRLKAPGPVLKIGIHATRCRPSKEPEDFL